MRAVRATDGGARSMRPPRGADGAAGRTEPGAMRGRSRLERAAAQYTAGAGGAAVGPALARGAGRARAVRATERRRAGCGLPSMGSGRRWRRPGVAAGKTRAGLGCVRMVAAAMGSSRVVLIEHGDEPTFFSFFSLSTPYWLYIVVDVVVFRSPYGPGLRSIVLIYSLHGKYLELGFL